MSGTCRDCRFWEELTYRPGTGNCLATLNGEKGAYGNPIHDTSKALAQGEDGYSAVLQTDQDFGCVQFEAREVES
jgi:hypothetical protein